MSMDENHYPQRRYATRPTVPRHPLDKELHGRKVKTPNGMTAVIDACWVDGRITIRVFDGSRLSTTFEIR